MKKIGIFYGSTTGTTAEVANEIANDLNVDKDSVFNVADTAPSKVADYDLIILGSSSYGDGDLQPDMADFMDGLESMDLRGKDVAIFGCGDETMADTFCNAIGDIYYRLRNSGANMIGDFNTIGYEFSGSKAVVDGHALGLLIDQVNHPEMTAKRIKEWCEELENQVVSF